MSAQPTTANPYRRRYNLLAIGSLIAGSVIAFLVLLVVFHHNPITALLVGFCWGVVPQGLGWGVSDLVAPGWVLRWRERMISGTADWRKPVGAYFSDRLGASGSEPWTEPTALRRTRWLGASLTAFWIVVVAVLLWVPEHLDAFYASLTSVRR